MGRYVKKILALIAFLCIILVGLSFSQDEQINDQKKRISISIGGGIYSFHLTNSYYANRWRDEKYSGIGWQGSPVTDVNFLFNLGYIINKHFQLGLSYNYFFTKKYHMLIYEGDPRNGILIGINYDRQTYIRIHNLIVGLIACTEWNSDISLYAQAGGRILLTSTDLTIGNSTQKDEYLDNRLGGVLGCGINFYFVFLEISYFYPAPIGTYAFSANGGIRIKF